MRSVVEIIGKKRHGQTLSADEISFIVDGFNRGEIPDYQIAAFLMAVCLQGMTDRETAELTRAIVASGDILDLSSMGQVVADKHSTGGVGDKTTLVVAPIVAAAGVPFAKMAGRGLGFTGGTIDKLESFPGFRTQLSQAEFRHRLEQFGIVIAGQSESLAPADAKLYALRDVTATVDSIPLVASSVMSKKIAGGAGAILLDVKVGSGAFMQKLVEARNLARLMVAIGQQAGRSIGGVISDMNQPLGRAVGNTLEVQEVIATLRGEGPPDFVWFCMQLAGRLLWLAGATDSFQAGIAAAEQIIATGRGHAKLAALVGSQGSNPRYVERPELLPSAPVISVVEATQSGYLQRIDTRLVGMAAVQMGAGRGRKGDPIDHRVGFVFRTKLGHWLERGTALYEIHAASEAAASQAAAQLAEALVIGEALVEPPPLIYESIGDGHGLP